jgi:hypothetical protein
VATVNERKLFICKNNVLVSLKEYFNEIVSPFQFSSECSVHVDPAINRGFLKENGKSLVNLFATQIVVDQAFYLNHCLNIQIVIRCTY